MEVSVWIPVIVVFLFFIRDNMRCIVNKDYYDAVHDIKLLDEEYADKQESYKKIMAYIEWIEELHNNKK